MTNHRMSKFKTREPRRNNWTCQPEYKSIGCDFLAPDLLDDFRMSLWQPLIDRPNSLDEARVFSQGFIALWAAARSRLTSIGVLAHISSILRRDRHLMNLTPRPSGISSWDDILPGA
jgi:hypothetical protein